MDGVGINEDTEYSDKNRVDSIFLIVVKFVYKF